MKITQKQNGYVSVKHETNNENVKMALCNLEDGLSYLGYALDANAQGLENPQADLDVAVGFLAQALEILNNTKL